MRLPRLTIAGLAVLASAPGCGSTPARSGACGAVTREALDPGSIRHVLSGASVQYLTDPPTSGAHQPSPPISGERTTPIPKPVQVGILEEGHVLVQYRGIAAADAARLRGLVADDVVVAPAASLPHGQHVVATAWLHKQACVAVDVPALRRFIRTHAGHGPS